MESLVTREKQAATTMYQPAESCMFQPLLLSPRKAIRVINSNKSNAGVGSTCNESGASAAAKVRRHRQLSAEYLQKFRRYSMSRSISNANISGLPQNIALPEEPSTSTTYANAYPVQPESGLDENVHPCKPDVSAFSRISKSRTLNVLSNLTHSFSRSSLASLGGSRNASSSSSTTILPEPRDPASRLPRPSLTNKDRDEKRDPSVATKNPRIVTEAQSSAYWSGRFTALRDRFHGEMLSSKNLEALVEVHNSRFSIANRLNTPLVNPGSSQKKSSSMFMTSSNTSAAILQRHARLTPKTSAESDAVLLLDDENRCRRVFLHLDALCSNSEARRSLRQFQQEYARRHNRPALLPLGGTMEDRSFVARLFSGRRSLRAHAVTGEQLQVGCEAKGGKSKRLSIL
jgi:hypothetical protein